MKILGKLLAQVKSSWQYCLAINISVAGHYAEFSYRVYAGSFETVLDLEQKPLKRIHGGAII
jgi:hypothetical protein